MKRIYLDYAASTPVDKRVKAAMDPYFSDVYGNAGSVHQFGQEASAAIFKARRTIAETVGAKYDEVIFTGSATEANNLALRGIIKNLTLKIKSPRIIISAFEHASVLETCRDLEKEGVEIIYIPVSRAGLVDLKKIKAALNDQTVLVSIMYANNEVGTTQPIFEISKIIKDFKNRQAQGFYPVFHTDAVQAFQYLDCNVDRLGVDLMTLSAHKIYGPKGIGALYVRKVFNATSDHRQGGAGHRQGGARLNISPIITGGEQEPHGLWSGTPNTPSIVGFGKAVEINEVIKEKEAKRVLTLRDYCWKKIKKVFPSAQLNGDAKNRLPNNLNIYFPGQEAHELVIRLDLAGVAVSSGVACSARIVKPSATLTAMGLPKSRALESLRISLGRQTTKKEIDYFVKTLELGTKNQELVHRH
ncbi:MAG: cysteine desulfurase family protein [Patescibacteria group bacterium]